MLTKPRVLAICFTLSTAFAGMSVAEGLAERNTIQRSETGIPHIHSYDQLATPEDTGHWRKGDTVAERNTIEKYSSANGNITDHIHRINDDPASGAVSNGSLKHSHRIHHHTYKSADIPAEYDTAYKRKRYLFDTQNS